PPLARLRELGVRRYSAGSAIAEAAMGVVDAMMRGFLAEGRWDEPAVAPMSWPALNAVMKR
ncbi:MAG TPA: hypothetical protein VF457_09465, partial [Burkholderiaceae bacterium]